MPLVDVWTALVLAVFVIATAALVGQWMTARHKREERIAKYRYKERKDEYARDAVMTRLGEGDDDWAMIEGGGVTVDRTPLNRGGR